MLKREEYQDQMFQQKRSVSATPGRFFRIDKINVLTNRPCLYAFNTIISDDKVSLIHIT